LPLQEAGLEGLLAFAAGVEYIANGDAMGIQVVVNGMVFIVRRYTLNTTLYLHLHHHHLSDCAPSPYPLFVFS
jgi:hypothetical protein